MAPPPPPPAELLAEHAGFLRALARRLVRDEHVAEDMVQEAYLAVLRRPPPAHVGPRAWLAGIVRNLSLRSLRSRRRRDAHEGRVPPRPDHDPASDVAARLEVQQRLGEAVRALPEPGRTAIVLRYYDGLTPTEIAARLEAPVRTVETRLRRAREALRAELDRGTDGGRRTWMLLLAPLALTPRELAAVLSASSCATTATTAATTGAGASAPAAGVALAGATLMTAKTAALLAPVLAAAAFGLGRVTAPAAEPADTVLERPVDAGGEAGEVRLGTASEEVVALRGLLVQEREKRHQAEAALAALKAAPGGKGTGEIATTPGGAAGTDGAGKPHVFVVPGLEPALEGMDWNVAGEAISNMMPLLTEVTDAIRRGEPIPPSAGQIQRWNGALVTEAIKLSQHEVPGTGVNGAFTHPAVQVNLIRATLAHAGLPLTAEQDARLEDIGTRYSDEDARRRAGYAPGTLVLQKVVDEAALKDRMYAEIDQLVTSAQREALHPANLRGRMSADLFSSGLVWLQVARPMEFHDVSTLTAAFLRQLRSREEVESLPSTLLEDAASFWARGFSNAYLTTTPDPLWDRNMMPVAHVKTAAEQMLKALRYVQERAGQDPKIQAVLEEAMIVWVPVYKPE